VNDSQLEPYLIGCMKPTVDSSEAHTGIASCCIFIVQFLVEILCMNNVASLGAQPRTLSAYLHYWVA
jgi:hypothetical protein